MPYILAWLLTKFYLFYLLWFSLLLTYSMSSFYSTDTNDIYYRIFLYLYYSFFNVEDISWILPSIKSLYLLSLSTNSWYLLVASYYWSFLNSIISAYFFNLYYSLTNFYTSCLMLYMSNSHCSLYFSISSSYLCFWW